MNEWYVLLVRLQFFNKGSPRVAIGVTTVISLNKFNITDTWLQSLAHDGEKAANNYIKKIEVINYKIENVA